MSSKLKYFKISIISRTNKEKLTFLSRFDFLLDLNHFISDAMFTQKGKNP